jgi:hypothetical protein
MTRRLLAILAALAAGAAQAQDRPSEDELFGQPPAQQAPAKKPAAAPPPSSPSSSGAAGPHGDTEAQLFGSTPSPSTPQLPAGSLVTGSKEDWLKIGGQLQLRAQASAYEGTAARDWPFSSPNLLDVYLDARPNDRVRGFVLGRLSYDPTVRTTHGGGGGTPGSGSQGGTSSIGFGSSSSTDNPGGVLDQLWINFDVSHRAFVTAGRQHVKWGVGKFWNPTDYLHPQKRDPLATFDARAGTTLVKLHVPWEQRGWNFYGFGIFEDLAGNTDATASRLGRIGGGARAELVLGSAELGLDAVAQDRHHPRYGVDLSAGVGDFDLYAEAAFRSGGDGPRWRRNGPPPQVPLSELIGWERDDSKKLTPQVVVGGTWALKYSDEDSLTVGAEYFYNSLGYDRKDVYPYLLVGAPTLGVSGTGQPTLTPQDPTAFRPFYLGQHYAAVNLYLPQPGRWNDTTLIATVLGNLSDRSYVARLDASVLVLTYMTVETFVAGHFGEKGGEFRLALPSALASQAASQSGGSTFPSGAPIVDVGLSLRVAL